MRATFAYPYSWFGFHDGVQEPVVEVHAQHVWVEVVEAHIVGADGADEPAAFLGGVEAGDDHADFEDFRVGAADAGGFGVDPQEHVGVSRAVGRSSGIDRPPTVRFLTLVFILGFLS